MKPDQMKLDNYRAGRWIRKNAEQCVAELVEIADRLTAELNTVTGEMHRYSDLANERLQLLDDYKEDAVKQQQEAAGTATDYAVLARSVGGHLNDHVGNVTKAAQTRHNYVYLLAVVARVTEDIRKMEFEGAIELDKWPAAQELVRFSETNGEDQGYFDMYWQLLRAFEETVGSSAGPLDKQLLKAAYARYNRMTGGNFAPSYI